MPASGIALFNSSFIGSSASQAVFWNGGRTALVVQAAAYTASALQLQVQGPSKAWMKIGSSLLSDQVFMFDAVPGQYRMTNESASSVIGINAVLVTVPYV